MAVKVRVKQSPLKVRVGQTDAIKILSSAPIGSQTVENVVGGVADVTQLNVSGISTFDGTTVFRDNLLLNADNKTLKIQNGSNFNQFIIDSNNGDTTIGGTLDVTGASTFAGNINANGNIVGDSQTRITEISKIGIGTAFPDESLDIVSATDNATIRAWSKGLFTNTSLFLRTGDQANSRILFGDNSDEDIGEIRYYHADNSMQFITNTGERLRITSSGDIGIGIINPSAKLDVAGNLNITGDANVTGTLTAGLIDGGSF